MKVLLLNLQRFDFVEKETGQRITGGNIHYITDETDDNDNVTGYVVCKLFVTNDKIHQLGLDKIKGACFANMEIGITLSAYGKPRTSLKSLEFLEDFVLENQMSRGLKK